VRARLPAGRWGCGSLGSLLLGAAPAPPPLLQPRLVVGGRREVGEPALVVALVGLVIVVEVLLVDVDGDRSPAGVRGVGLGRLHQVGQVGQVVERDVVAVGVAQRAAQPPPLLVDLRHVARLTVPVRHDAPSDGPRAAPHQVPDLAQWKAAIPHEVVSVGPICRRWFLRSCLFGATP
jgi:hypothetical protein